MSTIQKLENDARVVMRRSGLPDPDGRCVVYWMRRSIRALDNPSLDIAIQAANSLGKPVVVFFALIRVAKANLRHYTFLIEALAEIPDELRKKNVAFVLRRYPDHNVAKFCSEVRAALLITDENPLRGPEHRLRTVVRQLRTPVWSVDSDVVAPSKLIPGRQYAARIIRPKLMRLRDEFLTHSRSIAANVPCKHTLKSLPCDLSVLDEMKIDRSVQPASAIHGGTREVKRLLREFVTKKLADYRERRNHPEDDGTSRLSPYLHFGNISPVTIAREVLKADAPKETKDAFLDQLITWRELAINFVRCNELYDSIECAEPWAARTLAKHARDPRPVLYAEKQLENAETHDPLWNAAQIQMVERGWMHNYMRMYWGKKILEWTRSPAEAFPTAVRLNDKYELDGRDPNGYAGIAWAIAGKLDRPWFERPIFGQIRYMSGASTGKKFDSKKYIAQHSRGRQSFSSV
jgi:deoxyribodipyrimidine photo-lyase